MEEDIMEEILLRLPAKSLARCKLLSKKWFNIISHDQSFRRAYFSRHTAADECSLMLGFFFCPTDKFCRDFEPARFLPTSTDGGRPMSGHSMLGKRKRRDGGTGKTLLFPPDESLGFLGHYSVNIMCSSNGFLLCSAEQRLPVCYYIVNPITKKWLFLPRPHFTPTLNEYGLGRFWVLHGFICQPNLNLDRPQSYQVVRALQPTSWDYSTDLTIEILTSESNEWKLLHLTAPFTFKMYVFHAPSITSQADGVTVYMPAVVPVDQEANPDVRLVSFDPRRECLQLVELPPREQVSFRCCGFGQSEDQIMYAHHILGQLKVWALNESTMQWDLKHNVTLSITHRHFPEFVPHNTYRWVDFTAFHPLNSQVVFFSVSGKQLRFDIKNAKLELVSDFAAQGWSLGYYMFPYTYGLIGPHLFCR